MRALFWMRALLSFTTCTRIYSLMASSSLSSNILKFICFCFSLQNLTINKVNKKKGGSFFTTRLRAVMFFSRQTQLLELEPSFSSELQIVHQTKYSSDMKSDFYLLSDCWLDRRQYCLYSNELVPISSSFCLQSGFKIFWRKKLHTKNFAVNFL